MKETERRAWLEANVREGQQSVERTKQWLRGTRKSIEWHRGQIKALREEEKRCEGYVAEAEARLAEYQGWLSEFEAGEECLRVNVGA